VLGLGSAKEGAEHWWMQRLTAVALIPIGLWLAWSFAVLPDFSFATVSAWLGAPLPTILLVITVLVLSYHSHLGVRVVVEDYVHGASKVVTLVLALFAHVFVAVAGVYAILRVGFGG
jgi:succinate dehydrogenase / fumarate reductase membrane anchor subunit